MTHWLWGHEAMTLTALLQRPLGALSLGGCILAALAGWSQPARAQSQQQMLDRMDRLERELQTLQRQTFGVGGGRPGAASPYAPAPIPGSGSTAGGQESGLARLEVRLSELEAILATVTGRIEELTFQNQRLQNRLDKLVGDVDFRLRALEQGGARPPGDAVLAPPQPTPPPAQAMQAPAAAAPGGPAPGTVQTPGGRTSMTVQSPGGTPMPAAPQPSAGLPPPSTQPGVLGTMSASELAAAQRAQAAAPQAAAPPPATAQPAAAGAGGVTLPPGSARDQYEFAYSLLRQRDYANAEAAFRQFVERHKTDELAGNALYWLGETHYVRKQFEPAAIAFLDGYKNFPKGAKAPDNLLKLGMSLAALNRQKEACTTLSKFNAEFADAPSNLKAIADNERRRLACAA
jgi:tol-pal system protein YbgF